MHTKREMSVLQRYCGRKTTNKINILKKQKYGYLIQNRSDKAFKGTFLIELVCLSMKDPFKDLHLFV